MLTQRYPSYVSVSFDRVVLDAQKLNMCMRPVHKYTILRWHKYNQDTNVYKLGNSST